MIAPALARAKPGGAFFRQKLGAANFTCPRLPARPRNGRKVSSCFGCGLSRAAMTAMHLLHGDRVEHDPAIRASLRDLEALGRIVQTLFAFEAAKLCPSKPADGDRPAADRTTSVLDLLKARSPPVGHAVGLFALPITEFLERLRSFGKGFSAMLAAVRQIKRVARLTARSSDAALIAATLCRWALPHRLLQNLGLPSGKGP